MYKQSYTIGIFTESEKSDIIPLVEVKIWGEYMVNLTFSEIIGELYRKQIKMEEVKNQLGQSSGESFNEVKKSESK